MGIAVKLATVEHSHHANVLHVAVLHDGIEDYLAVSLHILKLVPRHRLQELRDGENGTGTEPTAHVVTGNVVQHGVVGNLEDIVLQFLQR